MAGEVDPAAGVFAQVVLAAAPHGGSCEVLRLLEDKVWSSGADGRLACSSFEGVLVLDFFSRFSRFLSGVEVRIQLTPWCSGCSASTSMLDRFPSFRPLISISLCPATAGDVLSRNWAQKLSKSLDSPTAAISFDGRLLAVAEETEAGFQA